MMAFFYGMVEKSVLPPGLILIPLQNGKPRGINITHGPSRAYWKAGSADSFRAWLLQGSTFTLLSPEA